MRQLATLPNADAAQTLADYLHTLQIEARLEPLPDGCAVWVCDEDRMAQAKQELAAFTGNPTDRRFAAARQAGEASRRRAEKEQDEETPEPVAALSDAPTPSRVGPWTYGLIVSCVVVFICHTGYLIYQNAGLGGQGVVGPLLGRLVGLQVLTSPVEQALAFASFHVEPLGDVFDFKWYGLQDIEGGQVWRLVTPIFLHFGVVHLLFNMVMLRLLGAMVEERRGMWRFLALVLVTAVASNTAQYFLSSFAWENGGVLIKQNPAFGGMSGVLYGLFGYIWMKMRYEPGLGLSLSPRTVTALIIWLFVCVTGVAGPVANTAHAVGLIVGVVIGAAPHFGRLLLGKRAR
jgi:GlpG protein